MVALLIVAVILLLFLILPLGIDLEYRSSQFTGKVKIGPLRLQVYPLPRRSPRRKRPRPPKKREQEKPEDQGEQDKSQGSSLVLADILQLVSIGLKTGRLFLHSLSVDLFQLYWVVATGDPYTTVMQFGWANAILSALIPLIHAVLRVRDEEIGLDLDVMAEKPFVQTRLVMTVQVWELLYVAAHFGISFLRWWLPRRRRKKEDEQQVNNDVSAGTPAEQKG